MSSSSRLQTHRTFRSCRSTIRCKPVHSPSCLTYFMALHSVLGRAALQSIDLHCPKSLSPTSPLFSAPLWCPQLTTPFADTGLLYLEFPLHVETVNCLFPHSLQTLQLRTLLPPTYFLTTPSKLVNVYALFPVPSLYFAYYRHHF